MACACRKCSLPGRQGLTHPRIQALDSEAPPSNTGAKLVQAVGAQMDAPAHWFQPAMGKRWQPSTNSPSLMVTKLLAREGSGHLLPPEEGPGDWRNCSSSGQGEAWH